MAQCFGKRLNGAHISSRSCEPNCLENYLITQKKSHMFFVLQSAIAMPHCIALALRKSIKMLISKENHGEALMRTMAFFDCETHYVCSILSILCRNISQNCPKVQLHFDLRATIRIAPIITQRNRLCFRFRGICSRMPPRRRREAVRQ